MWLFIIATLLAMFVKGLVGFGNTLVFDTITSYTANNVDISPVELLLTYPSNLILALRNRSRLDYRIWLPTAIVVVIGSFTGVNLLRYLDAHLVKIFFALVVIGMSVKMFLDIRSNVSHPLRGSVRVIFEIFAGLIFGMFGVGTLVAVGMGNNVEDTETFKTNLNMVFVVETTIRIVLYLVYGIITLQTFTRSLMLYPFMFASVFAGMKVASRMNERTVKYLVVLFLFISGISLLVTNLL